MEVDEAASHIKELVDPDANIIWGSAFNNDLGGKIRVSVVATGIEADVGAQPHPGKVFSFPGAPGHCRRRQRLLRCPRSGDRRRRSTRSMLRSPRTTDEELLLGADDILTSPVGAPPIAPPDRRGRGRTRRRRMPAAPCSSACRTSPAARPRRRSTRSETRLSRIRSTFRASSIAKTTSKLRSNGFEKGGLRVALFR